MLDFADHHTASFLDAGEPDAGLQRALLERLDNIPGAMPAPLRIGLIDGHRFTRDCLVRAMSELQPSFMILPFATAANCIEHDELFDLIIYNAHAAESRRQQALIEIREAFNTIPILVLSDDEDGDGDEICSMLQPRAHGVLSTRSLGIPDVAAAIRLVNAGGTFAPPVSEIGPVRCNVPATGASAAAEKLSARQIMVLGQLQQGKANKIIAHELGMSESTVKVHVRNIMRKMGATNRTQAAFKAQHLWGSVAAHPA